MADLTIEEVVQRIGLPRSYVQKRLALGQSLEEILARRLSQLQKPDENSLRSISRKSGVHTSAVKNRLSAGMSAQQIIDSPDVRAPQYLDTPSGRPPKFMLHGKPVSSKAIGAFYGTTQRVILDRYAKLATHGIDLWENEPDPRKMIRAAIASRKIDTKKIVLALCACLRAIEPRVSDPSFLLAVEIVEFFVMGKIPPESARVAVDRMHAREWIAVSAAGYTALDDRSYATYSIASIIRLAGRENKILLCEIIRSHIQFKDFI